ncbi:MAG: glycosyltransferase family 2 protein [Patescibacteria group bacterium]|jgi:GT2 family glycosyltransferase
MASNKKVLIVISVYNGADYLGDCLSSLAKITHPKDSFEILVIDDASTDGSAEYLKNNWAEIKLIVNEKNIGFAAGNNLGMQYAISNGFDYAYLLNQDTAVEPDFLEKAVAVGETDSKIGAVQSKLLLYQDKGKINSIGNEIHYLGFAFAGGHQSPDEEMAVKEITYPSGASVLLKTSALKAVGLFNEEFFMYHEDTDLGWRLWLDGYKITLAPQSVVYHKYEFSRSIKKYYFMERNRRLVIFQNYKFATILLISPACIIMDLAMLFYSFLTGWWRENLKVYWYFFQPGSWRKIIKTRIMVQSQRKIKDIDIIKRFVGKIDFQDLQNPLLKYIANPLFDFYWQIIKRIIWW